VESEITGCPEKLLILERYSLLVLKEMLNHSQPASRPWSRYTRSLGGEI